MGPRLGLWKEGVAEGYGRVVVMLSVGQEVMSLGVAKKDCEMGVAIEGVSKGCGQGVPPRVTANGS